MSDSIHGNRSVRFGTLVAGIVILGAISQCIVAVDHANQLKAAFRTMCVERGGDPLECREASNDIRAQ